MFRNRVSRATVLPLLAGACLLVATGCAKAPLNARLTRYQPDAGYRYCEASDTGDADGLVLILTFSGGGTRAAALAYGVLEELRDTAVGPPGRTGRLLDEVDMISSVSGGSFTAAYYGLFGDRIFDEFEDRFLRYPLQGALGWRTLWPPNTLRLLSRTYSRTDMAAKYYDDWIFEGCTFADLLDRDRRPFLIINATDMTFGAPFSFTQDQFDLLYSDLLQLPVAQAVAASSAFPILLSPITLRNYERGSDFPEPQWIDRALRDRELNWRRYLRARQARSYADREARPYVHLLDGGVADNLGLSAVLYSLSSTDCGWSLLNRINMGEVSRVAVIIVNAQVAPDSEWDTRRASPNEVEVARATIQGMMDGYTFETAASLQDYVSARDQERSTREAMVRILEERGCEDTSLPGGSLPEVEFYAAEVNFDRVRDDKLRHDLKNLPTTFELPDEAVDALRAAGREVLRQSPDFQRLLGDLAASP
jgi:NTE family protein